MHHIDDPFPCDSKMDESLNNQRLYKKNLIVLRSSLSNLKFCLVSVVEPIIMFTSSCDDHVPKLDESLPIVMPQKVDEVN